MQYISTATLNLGVGYSHAAFLHQQNLQTITDLQISTAVPKETLPRFERNVLELKQESQRLSSNWATNLHPGVEMRSTSSHLYLKKKTIAY